MTTVGILVERDPDGWTPVEVAVDGTMVTVPESAGNDVDVYTVDAGAGHEGDDWFDSVAEMVREAVVKHGRDFAVSLLDAYRNPPGRKYIDDFDAARERFDAASSDLAGMREE